MAVKFGFSPVCGLAARCFCAFGSRFVGAGQGLGTSIMYAVIKIGGKLSFQKFSVGGSGPNANPQFFFEHRPTDVPPLSFAIPQLPPSSVDIAFNARILSDLSSASLHAYLAEITRTTRGHLLHLNRTEGSNAADAWLAINAPDFQLVAKRRSEWNDARTVRPNEMEYLYERRVPRQPPSVPDPHPS